MSEQEITLDDFDNRADPTDDEVAPPTELAEIPVDWSPVRLDDVALDAKGAFVDGPFGSNLKANEMVDSGYARVVQLQNIRVSEFIDSNHKYISEGKFEELKRHGAKPGDLAIAKMAEPVARACLLPDIEDQYLVVADCIKLSVDESKRNSRFVMFALNSRPVWKQAFARSRGSTRKRINLTQLKEVQIPSPSLPEQRKIATVLYTVDRAIEKTVEVIRQYKSLKSGVLEDLIREGVNDHDQIERNVGPLTWDMPDSWSIKPVGELAELEHGHQFRSDDFSDDGEIPVLKIGQITESGIDLSDVDCIPEREFEEYADYAIEAGSPLIALSGATWGKTGYFESYNRPVLQNYRVGKVTTNGDRLDKRYLYCIMESSIFQKQLQGQVVRQAQENIGKSDFERIKIPVPPIKEQERISSIVSDIEECIQSENRSKQALELLKCGLIQDLLSGTVRTTDTNIEVPDEIAQHG